MSLQFAFSCWRGRWRGRRRWRQTKPQSPWPRQRSVEGTDGRPGHDKTCHVEPGWRGWPGSNLHVQVEDFNETYLSYLALFTFFTRVCSLVTWVISISKSSLFCNWFMLSGLAFPVVHSCCRNAIEQLCMFKRIERRPMAWPCQLTIGSCLSIRIVGYKAVSAPNKYTHLFFTVCVK